MYISRKRLVLASVALIAVTLCAIVALIRSLPGWEQPTWVSIKPHLEVSYLPSYTEGPELTAKAAVLLESTTETILFAKNEHEKRPQASTTKIMTALLALEEARLTDRVKVSLKAATTRGSSANLRAGQDLPLLDVLYGLMLRSGNDAAVAIAEHIAGSETEFVRLMNARARELGALSTQYQNPHGMDKPGHYSTAFDLAMLSRLALKYDKFAKIVRQKEHEVELGKFSATWYNTNRLLWSFDGCEGVKTGTTDSAGNCLVAAASRDGRQLISVVLGSANRWADSARLLEYGFNEFHLITFAKPSEILAEVGVVGGMRDTVPAESLTQFAQVVRDKDVDSVQTKVVTRPLKAPVYKRQTIAELKVFLRGEEIGSLNLHAIHPVAVRTPLRVFWQLLRQIFSKGATEAASFFTPALGKAMLRMASLPEPAMETTVPTPNLV